MKDVIVAEGDIGVWHYKKYLSGFCELDCKTTLGSFTWSTLVAGLYQTSQIQNLPFNITDPKAIAQVTGSSIAWISNVQEAVDNITIGFVSSAQSTTLDVNIHVVGNWS
jgi:hypothetical protein